MIATMSTLAASASSAKVDLTWHPHVSVWIVYGALLVTFWWLLTRVGPRLVPEGTPVVTNRQRNWLIFAFVIAWVFSDYPIHDISERYLLLVHMIQHTVFTLVAPAALLLGTPEWLFRWLVDRPVVRTLVRLFAHPLIALVVFNGLIAGTHWVNIVERSLHSEWWHFSVHLTLVLAALCMWMPVINRIPEYHVLNKPMKIIYLFGQSLVPMIPAAFLAFADKAVYPTYGAAPRLIDGLSAVGDQQISAAIMKLGGAAILWFVMAYVFIQWWKDDQAGRSDDMRLTAAPRPVVGTARAQAIAAPTPAEDVLTWEQVQAEFERIESAGRRPGAGPGSAPQS